jgi:hypothetical protein
LVEGWGVPLGVLAGIGIAAAWRNRHWLPRLLAVVLTLLLLVTPTAVLLRPFLDPIPTNYVSTWVRADALELFRWMRNNLDPGSIIFCSPALGNQIPAYTARTVVVGHWSETIDSEAKAALWGHLNSGAIPLSAVVKQYPMTHLVAENDELKVRLDSSSLVTKLMDSGRYSLYEVSGN